MQQISIDLQDVFNINKSSLPGIYVIIGDEMFSDTYPIKLAHDCLWEVTGKVSYGIYKLRAYKAR